jgi:hypothetical protein
MIEDIGITSQLMNLGEIQAHFFNFYVSIFSGNGKYCMFLVMYLLDR